MVRYYFHLSLCGTEIRDGQGKSLIDTESAIQVALRQSWQIMAEEVAQGRLCLSCHIDVENGETGECTRIPFREALRLTGS